jgi:hypothetical protein
MRTLSSHKVLWLALLLSFTLSGKCWADPQVTHARISESLYAGQNAELQFTIEWPTSEGTYEFSPPKDIRLINFNLLRQGQAIQKDSRNSGLISRIVLTYAIMPRDPGQGMIPSLEIRYRKARATSWKRIQTPPILATIKPGLPLKTILILTSIIVAMVLPFAILVIRRSWADRKYERMFQNDRKQQIYAAAVRKFDKLISGYTEYDLKEYLSEFSDELMKVIMTFYEIPVRPATTAQLLDELTAKNISDDEMEEITDLWKRLDHLRFLPDMQLTSKELETIIKGPSDFTNYLK